jgi:hypothetical protein
MHRFQIRVGGVAGGVAIRRWQVRLIGLSSASSDTGAGNAFDGE